MTCDVCPTCGQFVKPTGVARVPKEKDAEMAELYRDGHTLEDIGKRFGITRERVRQRLRRFGVSRKEGGVFVTGTVSAIERARKSAAKREAKCMRVYGCDLETYRKLGGGVRGENGSASTAWSNQRNSAMRRGVPWELTFAQWKTIWDESGKWEQRGLGIGKYCMARKLDTGPYAVGNVYITTCDDNVRDYQARLKVDGIDPGDGFKRLPEHHIFESGVTNENPQR